MQSCRNKILFRHARIALKSFIAATQKPQTVLPAANLRCNRHHDFDKLGFADKERSPAEEKAAPSCYFVASFFCCTCLWAALQRLAGQ